VTTPAYNDANFRLLFPAFSDPLKYPMAVLQANWTQASFYINIYTTINWSSDQLQLAVDLLAAHITASNDLVAAGVTQMLIVGATEGTVTVSGAPPPVASGFGWWLATTPYGARLRALLDVVASIGFYVGGMFPRAGFRNGWGNYP
jgi:hypothetical protein